MYGLLLWLTVLSLWLTFWHQIKVERLLHRSLGYAQDLETEDIALIVNFHSGFAIPGGNHVPVAIG